MKIFIDKFLPLILFFIQKHSWCHFIFIFLIIVFQFLNEIFYKYHSISFFIIIIIIIIIII